jgi:hypothetical protein
VLHFREFVMEWQAIVLTKLYNIVRVLPRWSLYVISGVLGSVIMNLFHRGGKPESDTVPDNTPSMVTGSSTAVAPSATRATPAKGKGKRGKK